MEDALVSAEEAILGHIELLLMDGHAVPKLSSIEEHRSNEDYALTECGRSLMPMCRSCRAFRVRVNITLPERVLAIVDEAKIAGRQESIKRS